VDRSTLPYRRTAGANQSLNTAPVYWPDAVYRQCYSSRAYCVLDVIPVGRRVTLLGSARPTMDPSDAHGSAVRLGGSVLRTEYPSRIASQDPTSNAPTVLIVEDSEPIRRILALLLEGHGYSVVTTDEGRLGLALALELQPQIITLDISLPDLDGRDVLRLLRADPRTQSIPVVVVSAYASMLSPADRALASEVLSKPFDVDELLDRVAHAVA
jgi:CheY-like chemotaxis protein